MGFSEASTIDIRVLYILLRARAIDYCILGNICSKFSYCVLFSYCFHILEIGQINTQCGAKLIPSIAKVSFNI